MQLIQNQITIDASVFISTFLKEKNSRYSINLFKFIRDKSIEMICPNIVIVEIKAALSRSNLRSKALEIKKEEFLNLLVKDKNICFTNIDSILITTALKIITRSKIKGMDSLYLAIARLNNCPLVTLDKDQLKANSQTLKTYTPKEFLNIN